MKKFLLTAVAISGMSLFTLSARAADDDAKSESKPMTGVLIDNHCGAHQKDEAAAKKHPVKCDLKEACADSGYQLIVGKKHYKLDDKGNEQAKAYLEKADADKDGATTVTIEGKMEGDKIEVSSIKAAEADKKEEAK
jgi:hypothetical protein